MHIQDLVHEDFINYRTPSMLIGTAYCSGKCGEACQNKELWKHEPIEVNDTFIIKQYLSNPITKAIVFGGLEPFDQWTEIKDFIWKLRTNYKCNDDVVIYTGYDVTELIDELGYIKMFFTNIIVKFGRYIPDSKQKYDQNLGVVLASDNQYSIVINRVNDK